MSRLPVRAAVFALVALIAIALLSAVALVAVVGLPDPKAGANAFAAAAAPIAAKVDMAIGAVVMLALGFLTARPFAGRDALLAGSLLAAFYILFDIGVIVALGRTGALDLAAVLTTYAVKAAAAVIGGFLASRRHAPA